MKKITAVIFAIAITSGCGTQPSASNQDTTANNALGACASNFASEGSFFTGTRLSTFEEFPNKTMPGAFDALLQAVATNGYQVVTSNKESGLISANQAVSYGQGKTAPLNFIIKKTAAPGVRVDISFSMSGGVATSAESAQREFCKLLASVKQSPNEIISTDTGKTTEKAKPSGKRKTSSPSK